MPSGPTGVAATGRGSARCRLGRPGAAAPAPPSADPRRPRARPGRSCGTPRAIRAASAAIAGARLRVGDDDRGRVARDRVAARAAVERRDPHPRRRAQRAGERLDRVRAAERDVAARVPAAARRSRSRAAGGPSTGARGARTSTTRVGAARAADGQRCVLLAVEVQQQRAADQVRVEPRRAPQPDLLLRRSSAARADRAARTGPRRARASRRSPRRRRRRAWCRRRAASRRRGRPRCGPARGSYGLSGSRSQTMSRWPWRITVGAASRPGVAGTRDDEVAGRVAPRRPPVRLRPGDDVRDRLLLLVGRARDRGERLEVAPEAGGLEARERIGHAVFPPSACETDRRCRQQRGQDGAAALGGQPRGRPLQPEDRHELPAAAGDRRGERVEVGLALARRPRPSPAGGRARARRRAAPGR